MNADKSHWRLKVRRSVYYTQVGSVNKLEGRRQQAKKESSRNFVQDVLEIVKDVLEFLHPFSSQ